MSFGILTRRLKFEGLANGVALECHSFYLTNETLGRLFDTLVIEYDALISYKVLIFFFYALRWL